MKRSGNETHINRATKQRPRLQHSLNCQQFASYACHKIIQIIIIIINLHLLNVLHLSNSWSSCVSLSADDLLLRHWTGTCQQIVNADLIYCFISNPGRWLSVVCFYSEPFICASNSPFLSLELAYLNFRIPCLTSRHVILKSLLICFPLFQSGLYILPNTQETSIKCSLFYQLFMALNLLVEEISEQLSEISCDADR